MVDSVFCNNCGEPMMGEPSIADEPAQPPQCRKCGSTSRRINHSGATGIYSMAGSTATLTLTLYSEMLLVKAQELITTGEFGIATVVAHTACEISAERAISRAFADRHIEYLEESVVGLFSNYNLGNERVRNLYNAVTGNQIQGEKTFWQDFNESVTRRNHFVHKGKIVTKAEAEASLKAASNLVAYLK